MSVRADGDVVRLEGECRVEEAETLAALLQSGAFAAADLSQCRHLHSAVAQALIAFRIPTVGAGDSSFLRDFVGPALEAGLRARVGRQTPAETIEVQPTGDAQAAPLPRS